MKNSKGEDLIEKPKAVVKDKKAADMKYPREWEDIEELQVGEESTVK